MLNNKKAKLEIDDIIKRNNFKNNLIYFLIVAIAVAFLYKLIIDIE